MAITSRAVSVTTSATRLDTVDDTTDAQAGESLAVYNGSTSVVYIGGSTVTTATGTPIGPTSWGPGFDLQTGDGLYAIVASGTAEVRVIETGV